MQITEASSLALDLWVLSLIINLLWYSVRTKLVQTIGQQLLMGFLTLTPIFNSVFALFCLIELILLFLDKLFGYIERN